MTMLKSHFKGPGSALRGRSGTTLAGILAIALLSGCAGFSDQLQSASDRVEARLKQINDEKVAAEWILYTDALKLLCDGGAGPVYRVHGEERGDKIWTMCRTMSLLQNNVDETTLNFLGGAEEGGDNEDQ